MTFLFVLFVTRFAFALFSSALVIYCPFLLVRIREAYSLAVRTLASVSTNLHVSSTG